jgi:hypothetical protein
MDPFNATFVAVILSEYTLKNINNINKLKQSKLVVKC